MVRALRPAAHAVTAHARRRQRRSSSSRSTPAASSRASSRAPSCRSHYRARGRLRRRRHVHDRRPVPLPADARRARPAPGRRGPPRGALRAARRARDASTDGVRGHRVRGLGAGRARGQRRRRLQLLGRPPAPDALARLDRDLGAVPARRRARARATSTRSSPPTASCRLKADPYAFAGRAAAEDRLGRHAARATSGRDDGVAERARATPSRSTRPMSIYEVHLGSWRLNPLEGNRSLTYLELADELAAYVKRHGLHARRAAAGDGRTRSAARGATR